MMLQKLTAPLCWVLLLSAVGDPAAAATGPNKKPNFLFIIVDDQSALDLKVYDPASPLRSPTIDRIAARGMVFDSAYHMGSFASAVCTPSRHMVMSGRTVWHLPIAPNALQKGLCPPALDEQTIPAVFARAGYDTMRTCKSGNSYEAANKRFAVRKDASKYGITDDTGSAWHAQQVLDYLDARQSERDTDPFLIYFGFTHPHDPRTARPELLAHYGSVNHDDRATRPPAHPDQPPLPPNYLPAHPFPYGQPNLRDEVAVRGVWEHRDEQTIRNERGRYMACSEDIDHQIAKVLARLEASGELEHTYVFYTSDHGIAIGRHGLQGKQNLYEHSWRVPMIVQGPGIRPGSRAPGNVYLLDVLATLCDLAGIPAPETSEGTSFRPVLEGKTPAVRDVLYGVYCGGTKPGMRCVKRGDWKLTQFDVLDGTVRETQLFNLAENPHELMDQHHAADVIARTGFKPAPQQRNLATDPRYAAKRAELEALLLAEMRRLDDPYRLWYQPDDGLTPPAEPPAKTKASKNRPGT